jgi:hypothetical protein
VGSPDTVAERIGELYQELGFGNFQLVTGFLGNLPQADVVKTLELFSAEVRPRFERALAQPETAQPGSESVPRSVVWS